jgi:hypothetical protein
MALYTLRSGATAHPEDSVLQYITDLIRAGGVLDLSSANHLKVVQRGAGANMSIDISEGRGFIKGSVNAYPVRNTAVINQVIANNTSGNPRKDAIVLYIDLAESPTTTADDVCKVAVVQGTPAASPVVPTDGEIQTAVGASNPFLRLSNVTVAHNESTIDTADVADARVQFKTRHMLAAETLSFDATLDLDVSSYNDKLMTLTANITAMTVTGFTVDVPFILRFVQGGAGGYTIAFFALIDWFGGTPVITPTLNKKDSFMFIPRANGRFEGYIMGQDANIS